MNTILLNPLNAYNPQSSALARGQIDQNPEDIIRQIITNNQVRYHRGLSVWIF